MSQKSIRIIKNEIYSKPPKKNYPTIKTDVFYIDDICSLDISDLIDFGTKNNRGYRHVVLVIDNLSNFVWTIPLKNKNAQTIKDSFEKNLLNSKRKPDFLERDRDRGFLTVIFKTSRIKTITNCIREIHP